MVSISKTMKVSSKSVESFNSFYEYSTQRIPYICNENKIAGIDISTYNYMLMDFYRGGSHERTLNENLDS